MARVQKELWATVFMACLVFCATEFQWASAISDMVVMHSFSVKRAHLLQRAFFSRDPREVGPELLGKIIVRRERRTLRAGPPPRLPGWSQGSSPESEREARRRLVTNPGSTPASGVGAVFFIRSLTFRIFGIQPPGVWVGV